MVINFNSHVLRGALSAVLVAAALGAANPAHAAVVTVMDQIGSSGSAFTGDNAFTSQSFGGSDASYNIAAVDDFTISTGTELTSVSVATLGFGDFTSYSNITGYGVEIYSSAAAATSSLTGDVAHATLGAAKVTVTTGFSGDAESALITLPVAIPLPKGTYDIAVIAALPIADGEIGVYGSTGLAGSTPGGENGFQTNPGGSFDLPGNEQADDVDMAYRITGSTVPEPSTWALVALAAAGGVYVLRRRALTA